MGADATVSAEVAQIQVRMPPSPHRWRRSRAATTTGAPTPFMRHCPILLSLRGLQKRYQSCLWVITWSTAPPTLPLPRRNCWVTGSSIPVWIHSDYVLPGSCSVARTQNACRKITIAPSALALSCLILQGFSRS